MSGEISLEKSRHHPLPPSKFFIVDRSIDRRYPRALPVNFVIPMYITLLHLCLSLCVNAEVLQYRENRDAFSESLAIPPIESFKSKLSPSSGYGNKPLPLVKRDSAPPTQSALPASDTSVPDDDKKNKSSPLNSNESNNGPAVIPTQKNATEEKISKINEDKLDVSLVDEATNVKIPSGDPVDDEEGLSPGGLKPDAVLRLFYVCVVIGVIVLIYILIKFLRFRRKRSTKKYRVLAHSDEQEMFPLAADDGDDEEIFNAADHQTLK